MRFISVIEISPSSLLVMSIGAIRGGAKSKGSSGRFGRGGERVSLETEHTRR
jgi:hypothetical protein